MNRNIKRIIALVLVLGTVSAVAPATNVNLLTTRAYASDDENDDETLDSLELETSSGSTIKIYSDSDYDSDSRLDDDDTPDETTYYAKTSSNTINIKTSGPNSRYIKVFKGTSSSTKGKSISSDISLSSESSTLVVRVYNNKPDSDVRYDDGDVASEYKIKVKYTGSDSDSSTSTSTDNADDYDDIYLDRLSVDGESISLSESKVNYSYNVASNVDEVTVKATPNDEDEDEVTIDGSTVDDSDKYKKTISLSKGDNKIKIEVENDDNDNRVYTLNIIRGTSTSTGTSTTTESSTIKDINESQWVLVNGRWQYNDALGLPIKNTWFFDKNLGKNYYLQADGSMAIGWLFNNGKWYYLGTNGAMNTGWVIDGGKYYYLDPASGVMAANTKIGLYKLGYDGAWIR